MALLPWTSPIVARILYYIQGCHLNVHVHVPGSIVQYLVLYCTIILTKQVFKKAAQSQTERRSQCGHHAHS
jgi:hypothetical protein